MPHRCAGCNTLFPDARYLKDGCPVCGSGKFIFEKGRTRKETKNQETETETVISPPVPENPNNPKVKPDTHSHKEDQDPDSIESIRILEPGRYDLNLTRLIESDDRVVKVGSDDNYCLDLHSMVRPKKKK